MRTLDFADKKEHYEMIYEGLTVSQTAGAESRALARIFTKLESVGVPKEDNGFLYQLGAGPNPPVTLEENEYALISRLLSEVKWGGIGAKKYGALMDWYESIPAA